MTPRERAERLIDLTGEIKQADQLVAECERDVTERWRQYESALGAAQKQRERRLALYDEAKRLGEEAKADFDALVPSPEDAAGNVPRSAGDAFDQAAAEALRALRAEDLNCDTWSGQGSKITDAFNAATTPQDTGDKTHIFGNGRLP